MKATFLSSVIKLIMVFLFVISGCSESENVKYGISKTLWDSSDATKKNNYHENYTNIKVLRHNYKPNKLKLHRALSVLITGGTAKMPNEFSSYNYESVSFAIEQDSCKRVPISAKGAELSTSLKVCFWGHELLLDPSNTDPKHANFSARMFETSLWQNFTYHNISTTGYVGFKGVNVSLKLLA